MNPYRLPVLLFSRASQFGLAFDPQAPDLFMSAGISLPTALKQAVPKRQSEFLAGRYCVQQIYQQAGLPLDLPQYRENQGPAWPTGYVGSISHTRGIAAAVLGLQTDYRGLGLDLEYIMALETAERVKRSILRPDESHLLASSSDWNRDLTIVFSFKESLYKALNPTLKRFIGFDEVQVIALKNGHIDWLPCGQLQKDLAGSSDFNCHYFQQDQLVLTACEWLS